MRRLNDFIERLVQVAFTTGMVTGVLEAIDEDGSLLLRQGRTPVWVPLTQVRYVTLVEEPAAPAEPDEPLT